MENKFGSLYVILGAMALVLIATGVFFEDILGIFNISVNKTYAYVAEVAFILSGLADFALLIYAKKKLS